MKTGPRSLLRQLAAVVALLLALYALRAAGEQWLDRPAQRPALRAVLFINGTLGDKSFFDGAARGLREAGHSLPVSVRVVEGGNDPTRWLSALTDLADSGDYDLIVTGTFTMAPYVEQLAGDYPDRRFVLYDAAIDPARCACRNVQSLLFRQNEAAYLAGFLAARLDQAGLTGGPAGGGLGVVGGMRFPVVEDFIVGFEAGAHAAVPGLPVRVQYANSFSDPALAKDIAKAQFANGAGIVFHVAGASGQGVNEAALETGRYAIGVDADQYQLLVDHQPALAAHIVTSVLKHVDVAVLAAVRQALEQPERATGTRSLGLDDQGVGLAPRAGPLAQAPQALLDELARVEDDIVHGRRAVPSAFTPGAGR